MKDKLVAQSRVFKIWEKEVKFPNNKIGKFEWCSLFDDSADAVMIAALTAKQELVFIKQYWPAMGSWGLIFPGGRVDPKENIKQAAIRELAEETNFLAENIEKIGVLEILPKYIKGRTHLFLATNLQYSTVFQGDEIEDIEIQKIKIKEILEMIKKGQISDTRTVALVLMVIEYIG